MNELTRLAVDVNDILGRYISLHNEIFKFSLRKIIPIPGIFNATKHCSHEIDLNTLLGELAKIRDSISDNLVSLEGLTSTGGEFIRTLDEYSDALNDTIYGLYCITSELCLKSRGEVDYPYRRYKADVALYNNSVERYKQIGEQLNILHRIMAGKSN